MTEIDYSILEGIATPVVNEEFWLHLHGKNSYVGVPKNIIISVKDEPVTVRIETNGAVLSIWKNVNTFHVTLL